MKGRTRHHRPPRELILRLLADGKTYREIQTLVHVSNTTIRDAITGKELKPCGRPPRATEQIRKAIENGFLKNARTTDQQMSEDINAAFGVRLHRTTVCRVRNDFKIRWQPPKVIQALTPDQKAQRVQFAKDMLEFLNEHEDIPIIFSDESRFCKGPDNTYVRYRRGEWNETACIEKTKFPEGVMFWGAIGKGYKSSLVLCSGGVDTDEYQAILKRSGMVSSLDRRFGRYRWYFMQDGAPAHTASVDKLTEQMLVVPGWPPNSPDLNPIEMLWSIIKVRLHALLEEQRDLATSVEALWNELDQDMIDRLVDSFKMRLQLVLEMNGESISGLLSSHMKCARPYLIQNTPYAYFSEEDDQLLLDLHAQLGNQWTKIANKTNGRFTNTTVKNRIKCLLLQKVNDEHAAKIAMAHVQDLCAMAGIFPFPIDMDTIDDFLDGFGA